jgi:hypothetical protein
VNRACGKHGSGEKGVQGFGENVRRKETTWKTEALVERDKNGSYGDGLRVWS